MALAIGTRLGPYEILSAIGAGASERCIPLVMIGNNRWLGVAHDV